MQNSRRAHYNQSNEPCETQVVPAISSIASASQKTYSMPSAPGPPPAHGGDNEHEKLFVQFILQAKVNAVTVKVELSVA